MNSQKYYIIEDFDPGLDYRDGIAIPLNPVPLFELKNRKIPYRIMEEFYDERELRKNEQDFFLQELEWFGEIDNYLKKYIGFAREHQFVLGRVYYNRIKYFVNSLIIQAFIVNAIVSKVAMTGNMLYVKKEANPRCRETMHEFKYNEFASFYAELFPKFAEKYKIPFEFHAMKRAADARGAGPVQKKSGLAESIESAVRKFVKNIQRVRSFGKIHAWLQKKEAAAARILFVHSGSYLLDPLIRDCLTAGYEVYVCVEETIFRVNSFVEREVWRLGMDLGDDLERQIRKDCQDASRNFSEEGRPILEWINRMCGVEVIAMIKTYFEVLIAVNCFEMLRDARNIAKFYDSKRIDFAVSHTNADALSKSAILASRISGAVKMVGIQHCSDVYEDRVMHMTETDPFDLYFTMDNISELRFRRYAKASYVSSCVIYQSPHYLMRIQSTCMQRKRPISRIRKVLYIPTKLSAVHSRYFNCMVYPILWFLEYERELLEFFSQKETEFEFIYKKSVNRTGYRDKTIIPYIENQCPNITIKTKSVADYLATVDAVIMDRPTTALYEAVVSGLPVLALYPRFIENMLSTEALSFFGKTVQSFSSNQEAFEKIDAFLKGDPSEYRCQVPIRDDHFAEVILKEKQRLGTGTSRLSKVMV